MKIIESLNDIIPGETLITNEQLGEAKILAKCDDLIWTTCWNNFNEVLNVPIYLKHKNFNLNYILINED